MISHLHHAMWIDHQNPGRRTDDSDNLPRTCHQGIWAAGGWTRMRTSARALAATGLAARVQKRMAGANVLRVMERAMRPRWQDFPGAFACQLRIIEKFNKQSQPYISLRENQLFRVIDEDGVFDTETESRSEPYRINQKIV